MKFKKFLILFAFLQILISGISLAEQSSNFSIIDSLTIELSNEIANHINNNQVQAIEIVVSSIPFDWLLEQNLVKSFNKKGIKTFIYDSLSQNPKLKVQVKNFQLLYSKVPKQTDLLQRNIKLEISGQLQIKNRLISIEIPVFDYQDFISREHITNIENTNHSFAKAEVPPPPFSWLYDVFQPAIVVGSAIITVILFFTVRSGS